MPEQPVPEQPVPDEPGADVIVTPGDGSFAVTVHDRGVTSTHTVTVPPELPGSLGWDGHPPAELVRASFEFLLEREPATSILRRFRLDVIADYFPEYPREIRRRLPDPAD